MLLDVLGLLSACSYALDCVEAELVHVSDKHAKRVAYMSVCMAEQLGISDESLQDLAACALLHDNALTQYENFDTSSINSVKAGLMGPLAGIGDSFMWGTLRIIATGIGTSLAMNGNILGPILFFLLFNIPHVILRYICMMGGYKFGAGFLSKIAAGGLMEKLTYAASILGLMSIGSMIATMVTVNIPLTYTNGDTSVVIADVINGIVPCLLPLLFTGFIYWLVTKKKMKTTWALILIFIIGILGSLTGILGV